MIRHLLNKLLSVFWPISDYVTEVVESLDDHAAAWFLDFVGEDCFVITTNYVAYPHLFGARLLLAYGGRVALTASLLSDEPLALNWRERALLRIAALQRCQAHQTDRPTLAAL